MVIAVVQSRWNEFRQNLIIGWNKRDDNRFDTMNTARERSIIILQKRYGYGREEAIYQLDKHYSKAWLG